MPVEKRIHIEKFFYCFRKLISCVLTNRLMCCIFAIINGCVSYTVCISRYSSALLCNNFNDLKF